jgi:hypothetical protein
VEYHTYPLWFLELLGGKPSKGIERAGSPEAKLNAKSARLCGQCCSSNNMVVDFANKIRARLPKDIQLHSLRLQETESSFAEWFASDNV